MESSYRQTRRQFSEESFLESNLSSFCNSLDASGRSFNFSRGLSVVSEYESEYDELDLPDDWDEDYIDERFEAGTPRIPFAEIHEGAYNFESVWRKCFIPGQKVKVKITDIQHDVRKIMNPNLYTVECKHGDFTWTIKRRYKHFQELHKHLLLYRAKVHIILPTREHRERRKSFLTHRKRRLPRFPKTPDALIKTEERIKRCKQLESYLQNILRIQPYRKHIATLRFLEVSHLSFIHNLGVKSKEGMVKKRSGGRRINIGCCICGPQVTAAHWSERWLLLKDTFVAYVCPRDGRLGDVLLMDQDFKVSCGMLETGVHHGLKISNLSRHLLVKCWTHRKAQEWKEMTEKTAETLGREFTTPNRFDSFAPERVDTLAQWFVDGCSYFDAVATALELAKEEIFITDWWLSPELHLKRPITEGDTWRLDNILQRKAEEGVKIFILLYKEIQMALGINSYYSKVILTKSHENIKILRHPDHGAGGILLWAHHEKIVCIDQRISFVGGLDLCYGRWDDQVHRLTDLGSVRLSQVTSPALSHNLSPVAKLTSQIMEAVALPLTGLEFKSSLDIPAAAEPRFDFNVTTDNLTVAGDNLLTNIDVQKSTQEIESIVEKTKPVDKLPSIPDIKVTCDAGMFEEELCEATPFVFPSVTINTSTPQSKGPNFGSNVLHKQSYGNQLSNIKPCDTRGDEDELCETPRFVFPPVNITTSTPQANESDNIRRKVLLKQFVENNVNNMVHQEQPDVESVDSAPGVFQFPSVLKGSHVEYPASHIDLHTKEDVKTSTKSGQFSGEDLIIKHEPGKTAPLARFFSDEYGLIESSISPEYGDMPAIEEKSLDETDFSILQDDKISNNMSTLTTIKTDASGEIGAAVAQECISLDDSAVLECDALLEEDSQANTKNNTADVRNIKNKDIGYFSEKDESRFENLSCNNSRGGTEFKSKEDNGFDIADVGDLKIYEPSLIGTPSTEHAVSANNIQQPLLVSGGSENTDIHESMQDTKKQNLKPAVMPNKQDFEISDTEIKEVCKIPQIGIPSGNINTSMSLTQRAELMRQKTLPKQFFENNMKIVEAQESTETGDIACQEQPEIELVEIRDVDSDPNIYQFLSERRVQEKQDVMSEGESILESPDWLVDLMQHGKATDESKVVENLEMDNFISSKIDYTDENTDLHVHRNDSEDEAHEHSKLLEEHKQEIIKTDHNELEYVVDPDESKLLLPIQATQASSEEIQKKQVRFIVEKPGIKTAAAENAEPIGNLSVKQNNQKRSIFSKRKSLQRQEEVDSNSPNFSHGRKKSGISRSPVQRQIAQDEIDEITDVVHSIVSVDSIIDEREVEQRSRNPKTSNVKMDALTQKNGSSLSESPQPDGESTVRIRHRPLRQMSSPGIQRKLKPPALELAASFDSEDSYKTWHPSDTNNLSILTMGPKPTTPKDFRRGRRRFGNAFLPKYIRKRRVDDSKLDETDFLDTNLLTAPTIEASSNELSVEKLGFQGDTKLWIGKDYVNFIAKDFVDLDQPLKDFIDRSQTPRMPWHDIGCVLFGKAARDVARHFIQRWNFTKVKKMKFNPNYPLLLPKSYSHTLPATLFRETAMVVDAQIIRSASQWSVGIKDTEDSIHKAYLYSIENAKHYIYIENQFFISVNGRNEVANGIADALFKRIVRAHQSDETFRVYIMMPLIPAFEGELGTSRGMAIQAILHWTYISLSRGGKSLMERLQKEVPDPMKYISFCGLRKHGVLCGKLVTELIYVHSKLMIVDDMTVIMGSANINDRSMLGKRDSELAVYIKDVETRQSKMNGKPYRAGVFASSLRKTLFKEHLGIGDYDSDADLCDPIIDSFYKNLWIKRAAQNTHIYEKVFRCIPNDSIHTFEQLRIWQQEKPLVQTDSVQSMSLVDKIHGNLVLFPLNFLCKENLNPPPGTREAMVPTILWT